MIDSSRIAILLFSRSGKEENRTKNFAGNKPFQANLQVADQLIHRSETLIRQSGFPSFVIDSDQQQGQSFGERLGNAIKAVFEQGFERVVVIGSDCPSLSKHQLNQAASSFEKNDWVLGPDARGGAYLIGLTKSQFDPSRFKNLAWTTSRLFQELKTMAGQSTALLARLVDLNTAFDLRNWLARFGQDAWVQFVSSLLLEEVKPALVAASATRSAHHFSFNLRGPPQY